MRHSTKRRQATGYMLRANEPKGAARAKTRMAGWGRFDSVDRRAMTAICVRREKAALSSGCKSHPANAPAGSNRSSHGGDEMAEGVSSARCLRGDAVAPVVVLQAQSQAAKGRELSTLAPLRALRARTPEPAWARRAVDEGVRSCPRAGCGKPARPVVCPAKAGMFSRRKACRGKSQKPRSLDSRVAGNQDSGAYRQRPLGKTTSHRAVTTVNAKVAS